MAKDAELIIRLDEEQMEYIRVTFVETVERLQAENTDLRTELASLEMTDAEGDRFRAEYHKQMQEQVDKLREALEEIRDLARTGLAPDVYPTERDWLFHKCNRIAGMAQAALA